MVSSAKRSLKGFLLNSFIDFKLTALIGILVTFGITIINHIILLSSLNSTADTVWQCNTVGVLTYGYISMVITFCIAIFVTTNNTEFGRSFVFPLNRNLYAIGNFLFIVIGSYVLMVLTCALQIVEIIINIISGKLFDNFYTIPLINVKSFLPGFFISLSYMIFIVSFIYFLSMFFHKYKLVTSIVIPLLIATIYFSPDIKIISMDMYSSIFHDPSLGYLLLKLWVLTLIFHIIAYIPLKIREVIK
ncbi:hypothetical protein AN1V17_22100 [Vallitalea sediminicola]